MGFTDKLMVPEVVLIARMVSPAGMFVPLTGIPRESPAVDETVIVAPPEYVPVRLAAFGTNDVKPIEFAVLKPAVLET